MPRPTLRLLPAALLALSMSACVASAAPVEPVVVDGDQATVVVGDDFFEPAHVVVSPGTTVTWEWDARRNHDVVAEEFASVVQTDGVYATTFDEPGLHEYVCRLHRGMTGVVEVTD